MSVAELARLVSRAQRGERGAFDQLVQRFEAKVYRAVVSRLGNATDAREVTQEVFLQAYLKLEQLRQPEFFGGWLRRIAQRMAINCAVRRRTEVAVGTVVLEDRTDAEATPLERLMQRERAGRLSDALGRLRALDREALVAFYLRGRSLAQMSREFGSPLGTIKRRLHVARKRLRAELEEEVAV
jgi:RNA polymerase sigma-70 factor (ECF subfamily)